MQALYAWGGAVSVETEYPDSIPNKQLTEYPFGT
jgi:hypothetical protein